MGISRVGIFPGGIFLEPYLTMFCFNYSKIEIRFHGIFKFSLTCYSFGNNEIDMNRDLFQNNFCLTTTFICSCSAFVISV